MPEIARFYGIIIRIFYESGRHQLPHIHAAYGEYLASYSIGRRLSLLPIHTIQCP